MTRKPSMFTALDELSRVLDPIRAQAVIDHRAAKRAKLTPYAAALLAREFEKCQDPNAAADHMILKGWQGFEAAHMPQTIPQPTQAVTDLFAARTIKVSQLNEIYGLLPKRATNRNGESYYTPEEVAAANQRRAN